jgi:hypothetical protein
MKAVTSGLLRRASAGERTDAGRDLPVLERDGLQEGRLQGGQGLKYL